MLTRRSFAALALAALAFPSLAAAQSATPSASQIERQLEVAPRMKIRPDQRVTVREFKRRPDLRRMAPSIDIQSINFAFGSSEIPRSQYGKVENIADALDRLLSRRPGTRVLIEGHTDAVGSQSANLLLSEDRAGLAQADAGPGVWHPAPGARDGWLRRGLPAGPDAERELAQPPRHAAPLRRLPAVGANRRRNLPHSLPYRSAGHAMKKGPPLDCDGPFSTQGLWLS